jgi:hypothetical protein
MESMQEWEERYGVERAAKIRKTMFAGYEQVNLIDTMEHGIVPGSVQLLERLFKGERDSEIVVVPPGEEIGFGHLVGESGASTGAHPVAGEKDGSGEE